MERGDKYTVWLTERALTTGGKPYRVETDETGSLPATLVIYGRETIRVRLSYSRLNNAAWHGAVSASGLRFREECSWAS